MIKTNPPIPIRPTLFLDFDETLVNSMKAFCDAYNDIYNEDEGFVEADHENVHVYNFKDQCPLLSTSKEITDIFDSQNFFDALELKDCCLDVLHDYKHKFNYHIVTIGTLANLAKKALWIEENLPFIKDVTLISNGFNKMDKSMIDMQGSELLPNIFIDDHEDNIISSNCDLKYCVASYGDRQWNMKCEDKLEDWTQIESKLKRYEKEYLSN